MVRVRKAYLKLLRPAIFALVFAGLSSTSPRGVRMRVTFLHPTNWLIHPAEVEIRKLPETKGSTAKSRIISWCIGEYSVGGKRYVARHDVRLLLWTWPRSQGSGFVMTRMANHPNYHVVARAAGGGYAAQPEEI